LNLLLIFLNIYAFYALILNFYSTYFLLIFSIRLFNLFISHIFSTFYNAQELILLSKKKLLSPQNKLRLFWPDF